MTSDQNPPEGGGEESDVPLVELADFRVDSDPDLKARVHRDINRRTLVADSLDFSLNVMLQTFWDHLHSAVDAFPSNRQGNSDSDPKDGAD